MTEGTDGRGAEMRLKSRSKRRREGKVAGDEMRR